MNINTKRIYNKQITIVSKTKLQQWQCNRLQKKFDLGTNHQQSVSEFSLDQNELSMIHYCDTSKWLFLWQFGRSQDLSGYFAVNYNFVTISLFSDSSESVESDFAKQTQKYDIFNKHLPQIKYQSHLIKWKYPYAEAMFMRKIQFNSRFIRFKSFRFVSYLFNNVCVSFIFLYDQNKLPTILFTFIRARTLRTIP